MSVAKHHALSGNEASIALETLGYCHEQVPKRQIFDVLGTSLSVVVLSQITSRSLSSTSEMLGHCRDLCCKVLQSATLSAAS
jgi:hypothetical protein